MTVNKCWSPKSFLPQLNRNSLHCFSVCMFVCFSGEEFQCCCLRSMLSKSEAIVWSVLFSTEALAIVAGNLFSILKFADTGQLHRRSSYLLINLAAADMLVGACAIPIFVYLIGGLGQLWPVNFGSPASAFKALDVISGLASILSLTLVSLERLFATLWPLRHRVMKTRFYASGIILVWLIAITTTAAGFIAGHTSPSLRFLFYCSVIILSLCCVTVLSTNLVIWIHVSNRQVSSHFRNAALQERRLTITLLIVTLISLSSWLPFTILNIVNQLHPFSVSLTLIYFTKLLHYGNSCANVFVYSLRITEFRKSFEKLFCCPESAISEKAVLLQAQIARLSKDITAMEMGILTSKFLSNYRARHSQGRLLT